MSKGFPNKIRKSFSVWVGCIIIFLAALFIAYSGRPYITNDFLGLVFGVSFFLGIIAFFTFFISSLKYLFKKQEKKNLLVKFSKFGLIILLLPLFLINEVLSSIDFRKIVRDKDWEFFRRKAILQDLGFTILILLFLFPLWGLSYFIAGYIPAYLTGLIEKPILIAGTGSMYPTFPKGQGKDPKELGKQIVATAGMKPYPNGIRMGSLNFLGHEIEKGDIVIAENENIRKRGKELYGQESGIVKRIIALPGDKIQIKDGLVYLNGKVLKEPYIARARSTFGGTFLRDCQELEIPTGKLFIMGDNRKGSGDSREFGLISYEDIQYVLAYKDQLGKLDKGWHDPKNDDKESARTTLDKNKYLELLNKKREEEKIKPLTYQPKLEKSSLLRGESILRYDDFSYEATKSGYSQVRAMSDAGYSNIIWNEGIVQGNFDAEELFEYLYELPDWKKNIFEGKDFQDFGIAEVRGEINGCPTQVVVQHLAGYVPPNYPKNVIESWEKSLNSLREIQPGWQNLKNYPSFYSKYKDDVDRINEIISTRISRMEAIVSNMKANKWLSRDLDSYTRTGDVALFNEQEALATKLNKAN